MRGRPGRELLRQSAPLIAVAAVLVVAPAAAAAGPEPDRAPASPPTQSSGLAPDPVPGTVMHTVTPVTSRPAAPRSTYVAPAATPATPKPATVARPKVKHTAARRAVHRPVATHSASFLLPHITLPALAAADPIRATPHHLDVLLAVFALLLAAVTAGSGARLVAVWNRADAS